MQIQLIRSNGTPLKNYFLLRIEATPIPENSKSNDVGGAYVNAWVDVETLGEAEEKAIDRIKEEGWLPGINGIHPPPFFSEWLACRIRGGKMHFV
jgi:hypothetical protein